MTMESVILVRLETDQAKAALKDLDKQAEASAGRAGKSLREKLGGGAKSIGLGAVGGVIGATGALAATRSGLGSIAAENLGYVGANIAEALGVAQARASEAARSATVQTHGILGKDINLDRAHTFYEGVRKIALREEQGALAIRGDTRFFQNELGQKVVDGINDLKEAVREYGQKQYGLDRGGG